MIERQPQLLDRIGQGNAPHVVVPPAVRSDVHQRVACEGMQFLVAHQFPEDAFLLQRAVQHIAELVVKLLLAGPAASLFDVVPQQAGAVGIASVLFAPPMLAPDMQRTIGMPFRKIEQIAP